MALAKDYDSVMGRSNEIQRKALGLDYEEFESGSVAFDYEALMKSTGYTLEEVAKIQARTAVGNTPLIELRNLSALARKYAQPGKGARIFAKDEAANASGSFKARRAACAVVMPRSWDIKALSLQLPVTTALQLLLRQLCRVWNASSCRNAMTLTALDSLKS